VLWTVLGVKLVLVRIRGGIDGRPGWQAAVLLLLSWTAALAVTYLSDQSEPLRWMLAIQVLVPPLVLLYTAWATIPRIHALLAAQQASAIAGGLILILGLLPWLRLIGHEEWERKRDEAISAERAEWQRRFDRLTPRSPVHDWMEFLDTDRGFYAETIRRIKALDHKQSDIERMLNTGDYSGFGALWQLDLAPTSILCDGVRKFLRDQAVALQPTPSRRRYYPEVRVVADSYESTLRWFGRNGCPMLDELNAFEATLLAYPDTEKEGVLFLAAIREIKGELKK
jgi:hypothetical protein